MTSKRQIRLSEATGFTLTAAEIDEYEGAVLVFGDVYVVLTMKRHDYDDGHDMIDTEPFWLETFGDSIAIKLGLMTQEEIFDYRDKRSREQKAAAEQREREEFERLRAKYEVKS